MRGRPQYYSDVAITSVLMLKRIFGLTLRALHGFVDSIVNGCSPLMSRLKT
ncbi:MAG: hypothetical protein G5663_03190 [Serratia symbiotica]|nr:hypothetical protein [Serratia symbiotica]